MNESVINSPNSAQGSAIGISSLQSMDTLMNERAISVDCPPFYHGLNEYEMYAKTYPFQTSQCPHPQNYFEPNSSLEDVQKFQTQLYEVLRKQEVRNDLVDEESFLYSLKDVDSISGASTVDTPMPNTSVLSIPGSVITPDFPVSLPEPEIAECNMSVDLKLINSSLSLQEPAVKKYTRKNIMARSKKGCWICRIKHVKCDERKPSCHKCIRFDIECDYSPERPDYVTDREIRRKKLDSITSKKRRHSGKFGGVHKQGQI